MSDQRKSGPRKKPSQSPKQRQHPLAEQAPTVKELTAYDEAHLVTYLRLLDANAGGERTDAIYLELEKRGVVTRPFSNEGIRVTIGSAEQNTRFLTTLADVASPA